MQRTKFNPDSNKMIRGVSAGVVAFASLAVALPSNIAIAKRPLLVPVCADGQIFMIEFPGGTTPERDDKTPSHSACHAGAAVIDRKGAKRVQA